MKKLFILCLLGTVFSTEIFSQNAPFMQETSSQPVVVTKEKKKRGKGDVIVIVTTNSGDKGTTQYVPGGESARSCAFKSICEQPVDGLEYQIGMFCDSVRRFTGLLGGCEWGGGDGMVSGGWGRDTIKLTPLQIQLQEHFRKESQEETDSLTRLAQKMLPKLENKLVQITRDLEVTDLKAMNPRYLQELNWKLTSFEQSKIILSKRQRE